MSSLLVQDATRAQYRILVADDTPAIRGVFQSFPSTEILVRGIVADRQALMHALLKSADIDAVLCSDHLAGPQGGLKALSELRARGVLPAATAFILMSGDARKSNLMANIEARPDGILLKPFAPSTLVTKLDNVVSSRRALAPLRELAASASWSEVLRLASELLNNGTRYPAAVEKFKLDASARLADPVALRASYKLMLAKNPASISVLEALARLDLSQEDFDGAEDAVSRLLAQQPANLGAMELMVEVLLAQGDRVGAQHQLQRLVRHSPRGAARHRLLGHLALLNGDTLTAHRAYLVAMRQHADATGALDEIDAINAVRAHMLHGDNLTAWHVVTDARKALPDSWAVDVLERLVEAVMCRSHDAFSKTQQRLTEAITLLNRPILKTVGPLKLAAIEASLITLLVHRAYLMSRELTTATSNMQLHPLQLNWAAQLEKWAVDAEGDELPKGMQHFHKFMR